MAAFTHCQCCGSSKSKNGVLTKKGMMKATSQAAAAAASFPVADVEKRKFIKLLLFGAVGLPAAASGMLVPFNNFFAPLSGSGSSRVDTVAKDEFCNVIIASEWLKTHGPGDRTLTQGLKGDPTYLMVENNNAFATYGINVVCTHLGCIVPWNTVEKKFTCPCHGSQFNDEGRVIKGPASSSLELARVDIDDGKVVFSPWIETDFRTVDAPWWS